MQNNYHKAHRVKITKDNPSYLKLNVGNSTRWHGRMVVVRCSLVQLFCPLRTQRVFVEFREDHFNFCTVAVSTLKLGCLRVPQELRGEGSSRPFRALGR